MRIKIERILDVYQITEDRKGLDWKIQDDIRVISKVVKRWPKIPKN